MQSRVHELGHDHILKIAQHASIAAGEYFARPPQEEVTTLRAATPSTPRLSGCAT